MAGRSGSAGSPSVVDLFAGAGGFSLGAELSGCHVSHAIEVDEWASDTLRLNHPETLVTQADIQALSDTWIATNLPKYPDLLIGGPPCQGFSHAASRKDPKDPRNSLFRDFVRVARVLKPRGVVIENVPGLLRAKTGEGEKVPEIIERELAELGFDVSVLVLDAEKYGVPQIRRRVFFVGIADGTAPTSIRPTHAETQTLFEQGLPPVRTLRDAISDLPLVDVGQSCDPIMHTTPPQNDYQALLRGSANEVYNHVPMRHSQRVVARFKEIAPGQSQSDVPDEHAPRMRSRTDRPGAYDQNNRRMHWDRPCHTLAASFYANFVHPSLNRNFTPREGARIQSFPDSYRFLGKPTVVSQKLLAREGRDSERHLCQYNQIGNAVPPLLAQAVVAGVLEAMR